MVVKNDDVAAQQLTAAAVTAIAKFEALPTGEPWDGASSAAVLAVEELRARARAAIYPNAVAPVGADTHADFEFFFSAMAKDTLKTALAVLHGESYATHPKLAALIRSRGVRALIAAYHAGGEGDFDDFERVVASQLVDVPEFVPWAGILARDLPTLDARLTAAVQQREARASAELARLDREQAEAAAAIEGERQARADALKAEAEQHERAAKVARAAAAKERSEALAKRLEKLGVKTLRLGRDLFETDALIHSLRAEDLRPEFVASIEAALRGEKAA